MGQRKSTEQAERPAEVLRLDLENSLNSTHRARREIEPMKAWAEEEMVETVKLLVTELVTNCMRHAHISPGDKIRVEVRPTSPGVRVEVMNAGDPFERTVAKARQKGSGWGLFLVDKLSRDWGISHEDGYTTVWFELD